MTDLEFDKKFDNGEDITSYLDLKNISRPASKYRFSCMDGRKD
jgi:hypothetical protein